LTAVMIGVDRANRSNTIEVIDSNQTVLVTARLENTDDQPHDAHAGELLA